MEKLTMNENKRKEETSFGGAVVEVGIAILVVGILFLAGNVLLGLD